MEKKKVIDYSVLHNLDSPANCLIRKSIWGDQDIGQQSFITASYLDELARKTDHTPPGGHDLPEVCY
jgi:hypothetical protein